MDASHAPMGAWSRPFPEPQLIALQLSSRTYVVTVMAVVLCCYEGLRSSTRVHGQLVGQSRCYFSATAILLICF